MYKLLKIIPFILSHKIRDLLLLIKVCQPSRLHTQLSLSLISHHCVTLIASTLHILKISANLFSSLDSTSKTASTNSSFVTPNHANASESNEMIISSPWAIAVIVIGGFFIISSLIFVITVGILIRKLRNKSIQDHPSLTITNIPKVNKSLYVEHQPRPEHDSMYLNTAYIHYKDIEHRWKPRPEHIGDSMCTNAEYMGYNNEGIYDTLQPKEHHYDSPIVNNYLNSEIHTVSNEFVLNPAYKNESFLERTYSNPFEIAPGVIPMQTNTAYNGYKC